MIDPVVMQSTFVGGVGVESLVSVAPRPDGGLLAVGSSSSLDFPSMAPLAGHAGSTDVVVLESDSSGSLTYATFVGGAAVDQASAVVIDGDGNPVIAGFTSSGDFPVVGGGALGDRDKNAFDAFVLRLAPGGSSLHYSTYLGGNSLDKAFALAVDGSRAYVGGWEFSSDWPAESPGDSNQGFVAAVDFDGAALQFPMGVSFGGAGQEEVRGLATIPGGVVAVGLTSSFDFPVVGQPLQASPAGGIDGFVVGLSGAGEVSFSTRLGGGKNDVLEGVAVGPDGIVVTGWTQSLDYPTTPGAFQVASGGGLEAMVTRLSLDGSALVASTYLGGAGTDRAAGVVCSPLTGRVYAVGDTNSSQYPEVDAVQSAMSSQDAFVTGLSSDLATLTFSSRIGGSSVDRAFGVALGADGVLSVVGETASSVDLPLVAPVQPAYGGGSRDALSARVLLEDEVDEADGEGDGDATSPLSVSDAAFKIQWSQHAKKPGQPKDWLHLSGSLPVGEFPLDAELVGVEVGGLDLLSLSPEQSEGKGKGKGKQPKIVWKLGEDGSFKLKLHKVDLSAATGLSPADKGKGTVSLDLALVVGSPESSSRFAASVGFAFKGKGVKTVAKGPIVLVADLAVDKLDVEVASDGDEVHVHLSYDPSLLSLVTPPGGAIVLRVGAATLAVPASSLATKGSKAHYQKKLGAVPGLKMLLVDEAKGTLKVAGHLPPIGLSDSSVSAAVTVEVADGESQLSVEVTLARESPDAGQWSLSD